MSPIHIRRHEALLLPESSRVIIRPFIPGNAQRVTTVIGRALALSEEDAVRDLKAVLREFDSRHLDIESRLLANFERVLPELFTQRPISRERKLLIGALFSGEYALESAALFNPSIVSHPDQGGVEEGGLRFVMSLRATGEGHISSIEFRTGILASGGEIRMDPVSRFVSMPEIVPNPSYQKRAFAIKLDEMGFENDSANAVLEALPEVFARSELDASVRRVRREAMPVTQDLHRTLECIQWLADSNYELQFSPALAISERIIFPVSPNESNGIEDARFVRFAGDDGSTLYYATYTAYSGRAILPQLIETRDFLRFRILTLNGGAVKNKGMALSRGASTGATPCSRGRTTRTSRSCSRTIPILLERSSGAPAAGRDLGIRQGRQLRLAAGDRGGLAGDNPWSGTHAKILHRRRPPRP